MWWVVVVGVGSYHSIVLGIQCIAANPRFGCERGVRVETNIPDLIHFVYKNESSQIIIPRMDERIYDFHDYHKWKWVDSWTVEWSRSTRSSTRTWRRTRFAITSRIICSWASITSQPRSFASTALNWRLHCSSWCWVLSCLSTRRWSENKCLLIGWSSGMIYWSRKFTCFG